MEKENAYLNNLIQNATYVNIYLANGIRLVGTITDHDDRVLLLTDGGSTQMVYKHSVSTVLPSVRK